VEVSATTCPRTGAVLLLAEAQLLQAVSPSSGVCRKFQINAVIEPLQLAKFLQVQLIFGIRPNAKSHVQQMHGAIGVWFGQIWFGVAVVYAGTELYDASYCIASGSRRVAYHCEIAVFHVLCYFV